MVPASVVSVFVLVACIGFLILSARLFMKYSKLSRHSRFDLYPIPTEGSGRAAYGGSYLEEDRWWEKERTYDHGSEIRYLVNEMIFIKKLRDNQASLWLPSFLFHAGIYLLFAWSVMLIPGAFFPSSVMVMVLFTVGGIGFTFATVGALLLLYRRLSDPAFKGNTAPVDYFNLLLILLVLTTGIYCWTSIVSPLAVAHGVLTMSLPPLPVFLAVHLVLLGIMLVYIPLSKMGHYAGKFFAFHKVLWDNDPNLPGSDVERGVRESAAQPARTQWSAPHTRPASKSESEE